MNINIFDDSSKVPQPQDKIRIEELTAYVQPDRYRVRAELRVTQFRERPNLILALVNNTTGAVVHEMNVIGMMHTQMEFTFHIRGQGDPAGEYSVEVELFYETRNPPQDRRTLHVTIPAETED
jgi:hypothetical protein